MSKSSVSETMGVHVPKHIARLIEARADAIGHKKSRYAAMIVEWWVAQGAPAISRVDETIRGEVMEQFSAAQSRTQSNKIRTAAPRRENLASEGQLESLAAPQAPNIHEWPDEQTLIVLTALNMGATTHIATADEFRAFFETTMGIIHSQYPTANMAKQRTDYIESQANILSCLYPGSTPDEFKPYLVMRIKRMLTNLLVDSVSQATAAQRKPHTVPREQSGIIHT